MRLLAVLALLAIQEASSPIPADLSRRAVKLVETCRGSGWFPKERYEGLLKRVESARTADEAGAVLRDIAQLAFDHDAGHAWIDALADTLADPEHLALSKAAVPAEIEVERITLKDGRVLWGTGGPLSRRYSSLTDEQLAYQRYLEPNFGMEGLGNWWIAPGDVSARARAKLKTPAAFLRRGAPRIDAAGRLVVEGDWWRPGAEAKRETVALEAESVREGGTLFVNAELGIRVVLHTREYPELAGPKKLDESFQRRMGWLPVPDPEPPAPPPAALVERVAALRKEAPDVEWPEPFLPDGELARAALARADLDGGTAAERLLKLRLALTYGADLPEAALKDPRGFLALESRVVAVLAGAPPDEALLKADWRQVLAAVRRAPSFAPAPPSGKIGNAHVRFPKAYAPWRRWPVLLALHGQYCQPEYDFGLWGDLADRAGMILVCPRYGTGEGNPHRKENDEEVLAVLREVSLKWNVDPDRVYVTGISMGGAETWHQITTRSGRWAAAAPEIHSPWIWQGKFPLLKNAEGLPIFLVEGEFDGLNTTVSRDAVAALKKAGSPVEHRELGWFGHDRAGWLYPEVLRWMSPKRREAHPATVEVRALHAYRASKAWVTIRKVQPGLAFGRNDGAFHIPELAGVKAALSEGTIRLERTTGKATEVEIAWDDRIMPAELRIEAGKSPVVKWTAAPSVKKLLDRVLSTGDREQAYADGIVVKLN